MMMRVITLILRLLFFFSSRRRHTRYWRDWSSDVCSSDLCRGRPGTRPSPTSRLAGRRRAWPCTDRSEERRVGKEGRSRRSPKHSKKKEATITTLEKSSTIKQRTNEPEQ